MFQSLRSFIFVSLSNSSISLHESLQNRQPWCRRVTLDVVRPSKAIKQVRLFTPPGRENGDLAINPPPYGFGSGISRRGQMYSSGVQTVGGGGGCLVDQRWRNGRTFTHFLHRRLWTCRGRWRCWRPREPAARQQAIRGVNTVVRCEGGARREGLMASIGQKVASGRMPSSWSIKCSQDMKNTDKKLTMDFFSIPAS